MKKILTVSLVAMMAVTAANADIASTQYVTDRTGDLQFTNSGIIGESGTLTAAVDAVAAKVADLSADMGDGGAVSEQIADKVGDLGNNANGQAYGTVAEAIAGAKAAAEADATEKANNALEDANSYTDTAKAAAIKTAGTNADAKINTLKGEMSLAKVGGANKYIASVTQADGKVTAEEGTIDTAVTPNSANLVTSGAVATAIAGANADITNLQDKVTENTNAITNINTEIDDIFDDIDAINNTENGALATMKTDLEGKITAAQNTANGAVSVNTEQNTAIEKNAADILAMDAAYKKADSDAKTAADNAYAAKSYESIVDADKAWRESIQNAATGSVAGNYALTAKVDTNGATSYTWELISR